MKLPMQLNAGESVVVVIRRHPISLIGRLIGVASVVILAAALWWFLRSLGGGMTIVADVLMLLVVVGGVFMTWLYWYRYVNDLWLVTNERLVDSTKTTPFNQSVTSASLVNLQDINVSKNGLWQTMLDFGDVICQTASASGKTFEFLGVAKPAHVLDLIEAERGRVP